MADIKEMLTRKIGPLPAGAWLVIIGGAVAYGLYMRNQNAGVEAYEDTSSDPGVGMGPLTSGYETSTGSTSGSGSTTTAITDNDSWARVVINYLTARGITPSVAQAAVSKYLNSETLTASEWAVINIGLAAYGAPPVLPAANGTPPNTPGPTAPSTPATFSPGWYHVLSKANGHKSPSAKAPIGATRTAGYSFWGITKTSAENITWIRGLDGFYYNLASLSTGKFATLPAVPKPKTITYTVPSEQTIGTIAKRFGKSATSMFNANKAVLVKQKVTSPNDKTKIKKGTKLVVPAT